MRVLNRPLLFMMISSLWQLQHRAGVRSSDMRTMLHIPNRADYVQKGKYLWAGHIMRRRTTDGRKEHWTGSLGTTGGLIRSPHARDQLAFQFGKNRAFRQLHRLRMATTSWITTRDNERREGDALARISSESWSHLSKYSEFQMTAILIKQTFIDFCQREALITNKYVCQKLEVPCKNKSIFMLVLFS